MSEFFNMINIGGLDFGNTKCVVSIPKGNDVHIELNSRSNRQTPTMVTIANGERYSGELSYKLQVQFPRCTITHLRDLIRFSYDEFIALQNSDSSLIKNSIIDLPKEEIGINVIYNDNEMILRSEQCIAFLLKKLASNKIKSFVTSISTFSSDRERRSLLNAFKIAKINCPRILNSTTAAAIAYSFQFADFLPSIHEDPDRVIFVDMGESDTIFALTNIKKQSVEIIDTFQIKEVSGSIITQYFENFLIEKLINLFSINPARNPEDMTLFKRAANKAKSDLTQSKECLFVFQPSISKIVCKIRISVEEFEMALQDPICKLGRQIEPLANLYRNYLSDIQFLGGSFQIEIFRRVLVGQIYKPPEYQINRDEFVALGCGYMASHLDPNSNISLQVQDIFNRHCALVNEKKENLLIIEKSFKLPYSTNIEVKVTKRLKLSIYNILDKEPNAETPDKEEIILALFPFADITISTGIDEETTVEFTLVITENGLIKFSNGFYERDDQRLEVEIKAEFIGDMTEDEINESAKIEEEMLIDDAKLDLKLQFEDFKEEFFDFMDPSIVDEVKSQISSIHSWYQENENNRLQLSDYSSRSKEFQTLTSPAIEQKKKYERNCQTIEALESKVLHLLRMCERVVDPRIEKISEILNTFQQKIQISKETPKYKDVDFIFQKTNRLLDMLKTDIEHIKENKP